MRLKVNARLKKGYPLTSVIDVDLNDFNDYEIIITKGDNNE